MESFKLENLQEAGSEWQKIIEPETPEQPLMRVRARKEMSDFEAEFALKLTGVTKDKTNRETPNKQEELYNICSSKYLREIIPCLAANQNLKFVYNAGKDAQGNPFFNWRVIGYSKGLTCEDALMTAKQLWQNLNVILKAVRNDYSFEPVISAESLGDSEVIDGWTGTIRPIGIEINPADPFPVGFVKRSDLQKSNERVIIVPETENKNCQQIDAVLKGSLVNPHEISVNISITPFKLKEDEVKKISNALNWLQNGEKKKISYFRDNINGIEDENLILRLQNSLSLWVKNPYGFRITCAAISEKPIPVSLLSLISKGVFNNTPVSISMIKNTYNKSIDDLQISEQEILDLSDCINSAAQLPELLTSVKTLIECGTKRFFDSKGWNFSNEGILIGRVNTGAEKKEVCFARSDRSRHCYVIGATGTGKSTLLYNMIRQDIENGEGVCVIDPHGDLYQQVLESIPEHRIEDVILIDPSDFENAVGINFLECHGRFKSVQMNFITNEMIKIFDRLYDLKQTGGPIFEQYMRNALLLCMDNNIGATLMDIPMVFEDKEYREFLKSKCSSSIVVNFWNKQAEVAVGDASLQSIAPYITSKLNQFTTNALLRPIIGQLKSTIDFRKAMDEKKIMLVNLSKGLLGELDTQLLGMLIIGKVFSSAMGRILLKPEERHPFFLYVDEFQNFTTDTVSHLLSEARKFGIYLTLANQNLSQLSSEDKKKNILESVLGNIGTILILRIGAIDSQKMEIYTKPELFAQDLQDLPDFHVAGRILVKNSPSRPFVFETLRPGENINCANKDLIIEMSGKKYTRTVREVERDINEWRGNYEELNLMREAFRESQKNPACIHS